MSSRPCSLLVTTSSVMSRIGSPGTRSSPGRTRPARSDRYSVVEPGRVTSEVGASGGATSVSVISMASSAPRRPRPRWSRPVAAGVPAVAGWSPPPGCRRRRRRRPRTPRAGRRPPRSAVRARPRRSRVMAGDVSAPRPQAADQALLHDGRHQGAVPGEDQAAGQARRRRRWAVLDVEEPVVGPERRWNHMAWSRLAMNMVGVNQLPPWGSVAVSSSVMSDGVGEHDRVDQRVVGQQAVGPQPHVLAGRQGLLPGGEGPVDVADLDGPGAVQPRLQLDAGLGQPVAQSTARPRAGARRASRPGGRSPPPAPGSWPPC